MQELWFLRFSPRLMLIDIHVKFCEDIEQLSSYRVDTSAATGIFFCDR